jgi:hypothetical protein
MISGTNNGFDLTRNAANLNTMLAIIASQVRSIRLHKQPLYTSPCIHTLTEASTLLPSAPSPLQSPVHIFHHNRSTQQALQQCLLLAELHACTTSALGFQEFKVSRSHDLASSSSSSNCLMRSSFSRSDGSCAPSFPFN